MFCSQCGMKVSEGDRFCTQCGAPLPEPESAGSSSTPQVEFADKAASASQLGPTVDNAQPVASVLASTAAPAVAQAKPRRHGLVIGLSVASAVVLVIAVVLSLIATNVLPNPLVRERAVTFAIKAPHYNEKTDSKIPLHITGKTSSGRVISQHVYVSPKAPVVHLAPGQYTVQVEASPLLSSGDVYRIPQPLKIDTTKDNRLVGESKPVKQDLKFEVKPANEVTASDLQAVAKFAKKTAAPVKKLDFLNEKIRRQKVATAFNQVLDMLSTTEDGEHEYAEGRYTDAFAEYSLLDIDQDGIPEMLTWFGVNGDKKRASTGPVGCGDEHDDFSGNRIWKYDSANNRAECLAGEQIPVPHIPSMQWVSYFFSSEEKMVRIPSGSDDTWITIEGDHLRQVRKTDEDLQVNSLDDDKEHWVWKDVFTEITQRDLLATYAMSIPKSLTEQGIDNYDRYALTVSNGVMNGGRYLVGTIKLMSPKQVQEFQHRYVVEHHLEHQLDPMATDIVGGACPDVLGKKSCGNPAVLYPTTLVIPVFVAEGNIHYPRPTVLQVDPTPWYLFMVSKYRGAEYSSDDYSSEKSADMSVPDLLKSYENKRVLLNADGIWHDQYARYLPWSQANLDIGNILATLPEATGQSQERAAQ